MESITPRQTLTTNAPGNPHKQYFPHIDGLGALAIIPVLLYHLSRGCCPGGFAGVDVFFVISGYLITRGIVSDLESSRFSITGFYTRRIKRILPAYYAMVAVIVAALPCFFAFDIYRSISTTAIYSALFSTNIYFNSVISYFDVGAKQNPLLHLWSLGVKEQYYFVIPALVWLLWRFRKKFFMIKLAVLFTASFAFNCWCMWHGRSEYAFFMLPARAWELLAGSLISQIAPVLAGKRVEWFSWLGWIGLALFSCPISFTMSVLHSPARWRRAPVRAVEGVGLRKEKGPHSR